MRTRTMSLAYLTLVILLTTFTTARQARADRIYIVVNDGEGARFLSIDLSIGLHTFNQYPSYVGCAYLPLDFTELARYPGCEIYAMDYSQDTDKLVAVLQHETFGYGLAEFDRRSWIGLWLADLPEYMPYENASMSISRHGDNTLLYLPGNHMLYDLAELDYADPTSLPDTAKGSNVDELLVYDETGLAHNPNNEQMFFVADKTGLYWGHLGDVGDLLIQRAQGSFGNGVDPGSIVAMDFAPSGGPSTPYPYDRLYTVSYFNSYPGNDPGYYLCGWTSPSSVPLDLQMRFVSRIPVDVDARVVSIAITPLPSAVLLGILGLSVARIKLRKFA